jgi:hypothetical protein
VEIRITIKQFGKKHPLLTEHPLLIETKDSKLKLDFLLRLIVSQQVADYQNRALTSYEIPTPQDNYMQVLMDKGKAGFGDIYNESEVNLEAAQQNVIQAFEDGIFVVFQGDEQLLSLSQPINLAINLPFTFLRLTFLAGSFW